MGNPIIEQIRAMDAPTINADVAARALGCSPTNLRMAAKYRPELLGFPVIRIGHRTRIPRLPFLRMLTGGDPDDG